ncbi:hypothetical protein GCM10010515_14120 [Streptomyces fructofermentans]|uniref:Uncharacterized protein n=1 Tax=Streptomyces fructofermentans TaxID=152141 RepID=A0A918K435_9ACTN|nr:hypothetical protein GCM10010515_14120 [Streptomyces fructofermentans]
MAGGVRGGRLGDVLRDRVVGRRRVARGVRDGGPDPGSREARRRARGLMRRGTRVGARVVRSLVLCGRRPTCGRSVPRLMGRRQRRPHCVLHPVPLRLVQAMGLAAGTCPAPYRTVPSPAVVW